MSRASKILEDIISNSHNYSLGDELDLNYLKKQALALGFDLRSGVYKSEKPITVFEMASKLGSKLKDIKCFFAPSKTSNRKYLIIDNASEDDKLKKLGIDFKFEFVDKSHLVNS